MLVPGADLLEPGADLLDRGAPLLESGAVRLDPGAAIPANRDAADSVGPRSAPRVGHPIGLRCAPRWRSCWSQVRLMWHSSCPTGACWSQERRCYPPGRSVVRARPPVCWSQERKPRTTMELLDRAGWNQVRACRHDEIHRLHVTGCVLLDPGAADARRLEVQARGFRGWGSLLRFAATRVHSRAMISLREPGPHLGPTEPLLVPTGPHLVPT